MAHQSRPRPWVKLCGLTRPEDAKRAIDLGADLLGINFWPRSPRRVDLAAARDISAAARGRATLVGVFVNEDPQRIEDLRRELGLDLVQLHGDEPPAQIAAFAPRLVQVVRADGLSSHSFGFEALDAGGVLAGADVYTASNAVEKLPLKGEWGPAHAPEGTRARRMVARGTETPASESRSLQWKVFVSESELPAMFLIDAPRDARYGGTGEPWAWGRAQAWIAASPRPVLIAGGIGPGHAARALAASGAAGVDVASGVESSPGVKDAAKMRRLLEEVRGVAT